MSIGTVTTRGYAAAAVWVVTRGYSIGAPVTVSVPSGAGNWPGMPVWNKRERKRTIVRRTGITVRELLEQRRRQREAVSSPSDTDQAISITELVPIAATPAQQLVAIARAQRTLLAQKHAQPPLDAIEREAQDELLLYLALLVLAINS